MSDELKKYDFKKFKGEISVDKNHSLQYLRKQTVNGNEIVFTIHITNKILKSWHDISKTLSCSFMEILNCFPVKNFAILVKRDNKRIDDHLRRLVSFAKNNSMGKSADQNDLHNTEIVGDEEPKFRTLLAVNGLVEKRQWKDRLCAEFANNILKNF